MDMQCFLCKHNFFLIKTLFDHLKNVHSLKSGSKYICCFSSCKKIFTSFRSFSRHMRKEFAEFENLNDVSPLNEHTFDQFKVNIPSSSIFRNDNLFTIKKICPETNLLVAPKNISSIELPDKLINDCALDFTCCQYSKTNFSRKDVLNMQENVKNLITIPIAKRLQPFSDNKEIQYIINYCNDPFQNFDTEYKYLKLLEQKNLYKSPTEIVLDKSIDNVTQKNVPKITETISKGVILAIEFQIKKYFEIEGVLQSFLENQKKIESSSGNNNFLSGSLWKEKVKKFDGKYVIPYFLYGDDFEINNPLGGHSSSILSLYYSFPTAPDYLLSQISTVFGFGFFNSSDVKFIGNDICLYKIVEKINEIERNGILIETASGSHTVYFVLGLILGDNLGLNKLLGFSQSFSALCFCRFCNANKYETQKMCDEDFNKLRTIENYNNDVLLLENGISENSILNSIDSFHVVKNYSVDLMHDLFEGVCVYNLRHIINYLLKSKYLTLDILNNRKQNFEYGESEIGNLSKPITKNQLLNSNFKMSAREMMTFLHYLPLMIGDLIPQFNEVWKFLILFIEIVDLCLLSLFSPEKLDLLKEKISYHNLKYVELFKDTLKPKHHFLVHYKNIIEKSGPLKYLWTFKYESKHRVFKTYTKNTNSRVNVPLSLAIKCGMMFTKQITSFEFKKWESCSIGILLKNSLFSNEITNFFFNTEISVNEEIFCYNKIKYLGTIYKKTLVLPVIKEDSVIIYQILEIIVINEQIYIFCEELEAIYNHHLVSYVIKNKKQTFFIESIENFLLPPVPLIMLPNGEKVIRIKQNF